jgi:hypothetical protein
MEKDQSIDATRKQSSAVEISNQLGLLLMLLLHSSSS